MCHLWITSQEVSSSSEQQKKADAYAKDAIRQAAYGHGDRHAQDDHRRIVVVIKDPFFRSHGPLQIVRGEEQEDQSFLETCGLPKTQQTDRHRRQAAPCDHRIAHQIRERPLRTQIKRPGIPRGSNGRIRDRCTVEMPDRLMYRH